MKKRKLKKWEKSNGKIWRDKDNSDTGGENIVEGVVQKWLVFICFIREELEQDLQKGNNEREARKRQQRAHYRK